MTNSSSGSGENLPHGIHLTNIDLLIISIVAIVVGLALTFLGRKLFKATLFVVSYLHITLNIPLNMCVGRIYFVGWVGILLYARSWCLP
jgi:hypothetical protein